MILVSGAICHLLIEGEEMESEYFVMVEVGLSSRIQPLGIYTKREELDEDASFPISLNDRTAGDWSLNDYRLLGDGTAVLAQTYVFRVDKIDYVKVEW